MLVLLYFVLCSIVTFVLFGIDKRRAENGDWRIPENVLIAFAGIGGTVGAIFAMSFFRHKTHKDLFLVGIPLILLCQCILFCIVYLV